jgi:hypothetical protein
MVDRVDCSALFTFQSISYCLRDASKKYKIKRESSGFENLLDRYT